MCSNFHAAQCHQRVATAASSSRLLPLPFPLYRQRRFSGTDSLAFREK